MAEENIILNRINLWTGGVTTNERDTTPGVHLNMEEVDIFTNKSSITPNTIFGADSVITRKITGYTLDENDNLFAIGRDTTATPLAQIWKKTTASANTPGSWAAFKTSSYNSNALSPIAKHQHQISITSITRVTTTATVTTSISHLLATNDVIVIVGSSTSEFNGSFTITVTDATTFTYTVANSGANDTTSTMYVRVTYLYYVTGTRSLTKLGPLPSISNETLVDSASATMTLPALGTSTDRISMIESFGSLYILNGQYISEVDGEGDFVGKRFTLPNGWDAISADIFGNFMGILSRSVNSKLNYSKVLYWDLTNYESPVDVKIIPFGGPQIIVNYQEMPFVFCAQNGNLNIYRLTDIGTILTNKLTNIYTETDSQAIIPDACKFVSNDRIYFGLWKTDKSGIYEFGRFDINSPFALILGRRFGTTDYSKHTPYAAFGVGPNFYASYLDNATATSIKLEGNNTPTYSSKAVIETVYVDSGKPEYLKEWTGFLVQAKPLAASCAIGISARVDNTASDYDTSSIKSLTSSNDQLHDGGTGDTYWRREWTSLVGRTLQTKITMTSNGSTAKPTLISLGLLCKLISIYG